MIVSSLKAQPKDDPSESDQHKYLIEKRKNEIEHMLEKGDDLTQSTREKYLIESKFLAVRDLYKSVFQRVSEGMKRESRSLNLLQTSLLDRTFLRRERLTKGDAGRAEKSGHMKTDNDRRKRMVHKECMQHLKLHKEEFMEWHRKKIKDRKKLATQVKASI